MTQKNNHDISKPLQKCNKCITQVPVTVAGDSKQENEKSMTTQ